MMIDVAADLGVQDLDDGIDAAAAVLVSASASITGDADTLAAAAQVAPLVQQG